MQSASGGEGGRRWKPEGGGDIIRTIFRNKALERRLADPRPNILITMGCLLRDHFSLVIGSVLIEKVRITEPEGMVYTATVGPTRVFEVQYLNGAVTYRTFEPGDWQRRLENYFMVHRSPGRAVEAPS